MISKDEIKSIANDLKLSDVTVEKDYVLGWILGAIGQSSLLKESWIFKGGTCLRKCFFKNYRFSEDLDFTIVNAESARLDFIQDAINNISRWVYQSSGIEINLERTIFEVIENPSKQLIIQGRVFYKGPVSPSSPRQWPRIKFDLTPDEIIVNTPVSRQIIHTPYSDGDQISFLTVQSYSLVDLFAEKIRALFERTRPRDLYDVVEIYHRAIQDIPLDYLRAALKQKCIHKAMGKLDLQKLPKNQCAVGWKDQLSHQLSALPDFEVYFQTFEEIYSKIGIGEVL